MKDGILLLSIATVAFMIGFGLMLTDIIIDKAEHDRSYKDVVCNGVVVLSGNGYVYKDNSTYTLAGKTYQMKDGETCWINDSYTNVEVE